MAVSARAIEDVLATIAPGGLRPADSETTAALGRAVRWVVSPASPDETSRVLALAHDAGLAVIPRGSGSALDLGRPPERADIVLDLSRMDGVLEYNPDDLTVTVAAGTTGGVLAARLAARGQFLAIDPPGVAARTIGGVIATNASGPLRARYGTMRDLLLGVRFVQPDGVVTWGGARVVKSVTGYDVPKLMVGALGTLGVLTELTLRLHPRPDAELSWLATFASAEAMQAFVMLLLDSTLQPNRVEIVNGPALRACGAPEAGAAVAVSIGTVDEAVRAQGARLPALAARAGGGLEALDAGFWMRHERAHLDQRRAIVLRLTTLPSRLAETLRAVDRATAAAGSPAAAVSGCASLGSVRVALAGLALDAARSVVDRLRGVVGAVDGSVVVERAPHAFRTSVDPWGPVPAAPLAIMRELKRELDPRRILNPGRFVGGL